MGIPEQGSIRELDAVSDQPSVALVFADPELRAKRANAAFRRLFGLPDEAVIGRVGHPEVDTQRGIRPPVQRGQLRTGRTTRDAIKASARSRCQLAGSSNAGNVRDIRR